MRLLQLRYDEDRAENPSIEDLQSEFSKVMKLMAERSQADVIFSPNTADFLTTILEAVNANNIELQTITEQRFLERDGVGPAWVWTVSRVKCDALPWFHYYDPTELADAKVWLREGASSLQLNKRFQKGIA
jgi:hypothetical protein